MYIYRLKQNYRIAYVRTLEVSTSMFVVHFLNGVKLIVK
jgi:hypothetical protein